MTREVLGRRQARCLRKAVMYAVGEMSASASCRPMRSAWSMRRLVMSSGRCTDPCTRVCIPLVNPFPLHSIWVVPSR